ncbi:hypothetical protein DRE_02613 [Drechslerella stenobrocha 248]|uniref:Uncharacterized protein n=1 Tax=Drechslerella stenobrocha 248 TaxID=1043628 RepID=W7HWV9_9PEZI|nr:hypothetical protein DRE_02613 [Drechslerella stenobrocha 248]
MADAPSPLPPPTETGVAGATVTLFVTDGPEDKSLETSVALIALVFAAVAFLVSFLQALLQYLTSSQRDKCLRGAIGGWSAFTKTGWDFKTWRIRVQHPQLRFEPEALIRYRDRWGPFDVWREKHFPGCPVFSLRGFMGSGVKPSNTRWLIKNGNSVLLFMKGRERRAMTFWDLSLAQKFSWTWLWLRNQEGRIPPLAKAGWANLLTTLKIEAVDALVREYEDADKIPSGVDVPVQRVRLSDLSLLCYMVNIKNVDIDVAKGTIEAQNAFIKVSPQPILGLGQAIVIDGDFGSLQEQLWQADNSSIADIVMVARGDILNISAGSRFFDPDIEYMEEEPLLYGLLQQWDVRTWSAIRMGSYNKMLAGAHKNQEDDRQYRLRTSLRQQASHFSAASQKNETWQKIWNDALGISTPIIIKYLAVMPFTSIWSAAPLDLFFRPYFAHLDENRAAWYENEKLHGGLCLQRHPEIELGLVYGTIGFLRETSDFQLIANRTVNMHERYTWVGYPIMTVLQVRESSITDDTCDRPVDSALHLPASVMQLMEGKSIEEVREDMQNEKFLKREYTLESAIVLSLLLVDCRLQALWCVIDNRGRLARFYEAMQALGIRASDHANIARLTENPLFNFQFKERSDLMMVHFIRLWFEIGQRVDLTGQSDSLQACLTEILGDWKSDDSPCISEVSVPDLTHLPEKAQDDLKVDSDMFTTSPDAKSKSQFIEWVMEDIELPDGSTGSRVDVIRKLIPLLQLRTFLMDFCYRCYTDSSKVYLARGDTTVDVRLI